MLIDLQEWSLRYDHKHHAKRSSASPIFLPPDADVSITCGRNGQAVCSGRTSCQTQGFYLSAGLSQTCLDYIAVTVLLQSSDQLMPRAEEGERGREYIEADVLEGINKGLEFATEGESTTRTRRKIDLARKPTEN